MKKIFALALLAVAAWACGTSYEASSFVVDQNANFNQYKTFGFAAIDQQKLPAQVTMAHIDMIRQAIAAELEARGIHQVTSDTESPELAVNMGMYVQQKYEANATTDAYPMGGFYGPYYRYYWGGMNYWTADTQINVDSYKEGTLMVDVVDVARNTMLWHGSVTGVMDDIFKDNKARENLKKACDMMFEKFPIPLPAAENKK